jgi:translation initiation factor 1A
MPKNKGKGGKNRRRGKNENDDVKRELVLADDGQVYAQVLKMLGNGRLEAICFDDKAGQTTKRLCHIRGKLRKKVWINTSDIILIGLRDFQDEKADVILKYTADEARQLKNKGEIPENVNITDTSQFGQDNAGDDIFFDEQFSDEDDSDDSQSGSKGYQAQGASGNYNTGNLNRRNINVTDNYLDDMSGSEDEEEEDNE